MSEEMLKAIDDALLRAWHLGQSYFADADSESISANRRADLTLNRFEVFRKEMRERFAAREDA